MFFVTQTNKQTKLAVWTTPNRAPQRYSNLTLLQETSKRVGWIANTSSLRRLAAFLRNSIRALAINE